MAYTAADLAALKANIAKGVTSLEVAGEKVTFRSLDEMLKLAAVIEAELDAGLSRRGGLHLPTFSRG
ncbi:MULTISPECIES: phage head-tail joining protein [Paracoccus]|uniref:GpW protein n=1 Tax=Paracoccus versutus TaxID=34007 RepID=A0A3D9XPD8_PARVE|nr:MULTISPECIES: hypothetical protein [Paracoccus]AZV00195.1 hypothetical protein pben1_p38 [Paracoccus phage vB_PbeS_Pben1]SFY23424.1 hypothetical protein SAMN04244548_03188 [Paracoccus pantotrophus]MBT0779559.1 hypothetical protein [Paracoccus sp. pheM1]MDK8871498.1 hypothetical protein [Paracoccus sp. SSJ]REF72307.1 hypothetical protein BDD41_0776 [Paracoccus versutus]